MSATARRRYSFLLTPRWLWLITALVLVSAVCVFLGVWQWERHLGRSAIVAQVERAYDAEPVPVAELVGPGEPVTDDVEYRPVVLEGAYVEGATVLLRNRPVGGSPAVHVVTPFVADVGGEPLVVVVERGWLPADAATGGTAVPGPPAGEVSLVARLRVGEDVDPRARQAPRGQTYTLAPADVLAAAGTVTDLGAAAQLPVLDGYVQVAETDPEPAQRPEPFPYPDTDLGPHLSYAFQWWVFALGALVGIGVLARREARENDELALLAAAGADADGAPPARRRRRRTAEEEEDALVDAELRRRQDG